MSDHSITPSPKKSASGRTSIRRHGQRPTAEQRREAQEAFLRSFASNGNVRAACMSAGIDRSTVHYWAERDEQFSMRYNLAQHDVDDAIRAEIYRRGMFGEEEPMVSMGRVVTRKNEKGEEVPLTIRRKSDLLLMFHAKARMPEYRDKQQVEHSGNIDITGAKDSLLNKLAQATRSQDGSEDK
jgi:hypothetical protein